MSLMTRLLLASKAVRELGARSLFFYLRYRIKRLIGLVRLQTPIRQIAINSKLNVKPLSIPIDKEKLEKTIGDEKTRLFDQAEEIVKGKVKLFGTEPRPLNFEAKFPLTHWTNYEHSLPEGTDIKPVWEIGRFGWATLLARAYYLSDDEKYAESFWGLTESFFSSNPINAGPQWSSGQEVALRLISLAFCLGLIAGSSASTVGRKSWLAEVLAAHAQRILPTLDYARSQNNNHLLSEAAGLFTAATLLPDHPESRTWRKTGIKLFIEGIEAQIHDDGSYAQHSANYHRLMLQVATWFVVARSEHDPVLTNLAARLSRSVDWLGRLLDQDSGKVPNLGPNDGAYLLPSSILPFEDFRPALQAASQAFGQQGCLEAGPWDELACWLGLEGPQAAKKPKAGQPLRIDGKYSWAYVRAAQFEERPGHADQLHIDLWWRGFNIAMDPGSYLYRADAPWDNALADTQVHNTLTIEGRDQMTRAGRFLWLDWAQANVVEAGPTSATAEHNGYDHLGIRHRREVRVDETESWVITDQILPLKKTKAAHATLHWLLPDWAWQFENYQLKFESPNGDVKLAVQTGAGVASRFRLIRGGQLVHGDGSPDPILGWFSPTYSLKQPALSLCVDVTGMLPITITSTFTFPKNG